MLKLKMEVPRWSSDIGQAFQSNAMEDRKLKVQINRINSAKKEKLEKIDQEMMSLKKQLLEDRKLLGTRSVIQRRENKNANILVENSDQKHVCVQPKLIGPQKAEVTESKSFKPIQERSRDEIAVKQNYIRMRPSRLVSVVREKNDNFGRRGVSFEVEKFAPSSSTPAPRCRGRRHSIAEINLSDSFSKICTPQTSSGNATIRNEQIGSGITGGKLDHPLLRQRRASLPYTLTPERRENLIASPRLKPIRFAPDKLAVDESKASPNVKLGNFSRHVEGSNLRRKRRNSLPNFDNFPSSRDSMASKERLTARLVSRTKPASARQRNMSPSKRISAFGRQFKKNPTPVTEQSNEGDSNEEEESESLERISQGEGDNDKDKEIESEKEPSVAQELCFIPKATLQEKMNKFFSNWVEDCDEETRTDIEELLQEFRKEKREGRQDINEDIVVESKGTAQESQEKSNQ